MRRPGPGRIRWKHWGWFEMARRKFQPVVRILRVHVGCPFGMPDKGRNEACVADALAGLDSWKRLKMENKDDGVERADSERRRKKKRRREKKKKECLAVDKARMKSDRLD